MTTSTLKKKIHQYIDTTDEKILKVVYTILEEHDKLKQENDFKLSNTDIAELDRRWIAYKKGKMKTYTVEEVKLEINKKLKSRKQ